VLQTVQGQQNTPLDFIGNTAQKSYAAGSRNFQFEFAFWRERQCEIPPDLQQSPEGSVRLIFCVNEHTHTPTIRITTTATPSRVLKIIPITTDYSLLSFITFFRKIGQTDGRSPCWTRSEHLV
jgi:hypothetical protein